LAKRSESTWADARPAEASITSSICRACPGPLLLLDHEEGPLTDTAGHLKKVGLFVVTDLAYQRA
jgi:hypothetical protein